MTHHAFQTFTAKWACENLRLMRISKSLAGLLALAALATGCSTTRVTNLTPYEAKRDPSGLYPFEATFHTTQTTVIHESLKAYVVIDQNFYPMKPTEIVEGRWETLVPIDEKKKKVYYRYKFDYNVNSLTGVPEGSSKLSEPYQLEIK